MSEKRKDINLLFLEALEKRTVKERATYLDEVCRDDRKLRTELVSLLKAHDEAGDFLDAPIFEPDIWLDDSPLTEGPGTVIGPYKLLEKIGEGGMACVYMAEQDKPLRRKVALKIIKLGMDTKSVIARFEAEKQALAIMDHPNVAKVYDAGATDTGRPYFVMELLKGVSVTQYCDKNRLSARERLELFMQVCNAVQHAHQKGIIHRDIKPSNVMVTLHDGRPVPKVIDFGIAKATSQRLTEKTLFTRYAHMIGTPAYMSPEQAEFSGLDIDTRTDIYSLGVMLYELLTGTTPFDTDELREAGYAEMQRIIREEEPVKPSTKLSTMGEALTEVAEHRKTNPDSLPKLISGDLDWIVMKSLEKDRIRRYDTATGLAADIERHLNSEPVQAAAPSVSYRLRKFLRRHRVSAIAGSLVAAALVVVAVVSAMYAREVAIHANEAAIHANEAEDARQNAVKAKQEIVGLLAGSYVDRAQALCEQGEIGRGMLRFAHSLKTTPVDAGDLEQAIRTNLAAWGRHLNGLRMLVQHKSEVLAVALSPNGSRILAGCSGGTVRLWDVATGRAVGEGIRLQGKVHAVAFSPDGSRILTGSDDGTARLWDAATLKLIGDPLRHQPLGGPPDAADAVKFVAFSPDGARLATASGSGKVGVVRLWDAATLKAIGQPLERGNSLAIRFCPEGLRVVVNIAWDVHQLWDVDRGQPIGPPVKHHTGRIGAAAISPDGSTFATAGGGSTIQLWDAATGKQALPPMVHGGVVVAMAFSPDGTHVVSGGNTRAALLFDATTGQRVGTPLRQRSTVFAVAFSADGTRILTGSDDGSVRLWDVAPNNVLGQPIQSDDTLVTAAFSPDGLRILTERDGLFQLKDATTGDAVSKPFAIDNLIKSGGRMSFSPDGSRLLINPNWSGELRDVATGQLIGELLRLVALHDCAFSPDGSQILAGYQQGDAVLFDANTLEPVGEPLHHLTGPVTGFAVVVHCVAFSPDGSRIVTGGYDGITRLWDAATLAPIGEPLVHQSEVKALAYSPDGTKILIGFGDGTVRLWDLATLEPVGPPLHHQEIVSSVAFSPDGARFLTCSLDQTARLWDTATQRPIGPPIRHEEAWWPKVSFSPDGSQFLVASRGTARLWETPPGPLKGDRERIVLWAQVITGLELDDIDMGGIGGLDGPTWQKLHRQLQQRGGPPTAGKDTSDGGQAAFTARQRGSELWVMENFLPE